MNITHANYPHVSSYVAAWKKLNAIYKNNPESPVILDRYDGETTAKEAREKFIKAMHNRINSRGNDSKRGKKDDYDYLMNLRRDFYKLKDIHNRIRVYQFNTQEVRSRFSHLLSNYHDDF
jgi:hypothetical protein